ncbi:flagellar basal body rod protein FlgB [Blastochloris tepida]|jgi:flagellar basal-body rod protein FlgB|uniref:Flagellar basal body rod protein FlgB n=1 Tax=Blastochloris tepida TaxID=2233851 RepID=A0A348FX23_9HYPH|nr:flagellar basal body rod protein FlgB [Blastochloris tepida]BBF91856.1 flagellar basal body rod protein FlgB [Blastochloris tepida]
MILADVPLVGMLKTRMGWLQSRQRVLAQNVAHADTPGFRARDLEPVDFKKILTQVPMQRTAMAVTNPEHIAGAASVETDRFGQPRASGKFEIRPSGNAVALEEEMMKVAQTQLDYQTATSLYSRSLGLIKTALGKTK